MGINSLTCSLSGFSLTAQCLVLLFQAHRAAKVIKLSPDKITASQGISHLSHHGSNLPQDLNGSWGYQYCSSLNQ